MSSSRLTGLLASLLLAILLAFTIPGGALRAQMNNSWQIQQQRQQEMLRQQQMQQEQMRRQQQEQLRQQQRQQLQAQQRQQMQAQQRHQMQAQQRQAMQQQQQQALQQQQRNKLQKQQIDQAKNAQQVGKPPPTGTPAHIANKPTGPMVFSNGVARLTRPLTPAEISRGFTGKVTPNGRALIKFQGRIFAVPASRVSGLTAKLAAQQRQAPWTAQQRASANEKVKNLSASTYRRTEFTRANADGSIAKEQTRIEKATRSATSPQVQARIDAGRAAMLQNQNAKGAGAGGAGSGNSASGGGDGGKRGIKDQFDKAATSQYKPLGRGSTANQIEGTTLPRNVREEMAVKQVMSNPQSGTVLPLRMNDQRWPHSDGWEKRTQTVNSGGESITVHYVRNTKTGDIDDFKIVIPGYRPKKR